MYNIFPISNHIGKLSWNSYDSIGMCLGVGMGYLIKKRKFSNDDEDSQDDPKDKHSHDDDIDNGGVLNLESSVNEMKEIPALAVNDSNKT